jgi:hypothetical protein
MYLLAELPGKPLNWGHVSHMHFWIDEIRPLNQVDGGGDPLPRWRD